MTPIDAHKEKLSANTAIASDITGGNGHRLDCDVWLPEASKHYQISSNIRDYVISPVPAIISGIPNTNGVAMPTSELLSFIPDEGRLSYKTWKAKPSFREHENKDITKAKGVILDAYVSPLRNFGKGLIKVIMLVAYDRSKDPELASAILSGEENAYSMGAYFEGYRCSICGREANGCKHTSPRDALKLDPISQTLAYRNIYGIVGFEISSVTAPAYICAVSDILLGVTN